MVKTDETVISKQREYLEEQITLQKCKGVSTFTKIIDVANSADNSIVGPIETYYRVHLSTIVNIDEFDVYKSANGTVIHFIVIDKLKRIEPTQWVLIGLGKYEQIDYPSIYLGANLFQHGDNLYTINSNGVHVLNAIFRPLLRTEDYDEQQLLDDYVLRLTLHQPEYEYTLDRGTSGNVYLDIKIKLSIPVEDNPWGGDLEYTYTHVLISKSPIEWMYNVTTRNLPVLRSIYYQDKSPKSE